VYVCNSGGYGSHDMGGLTIPDSYLPGHHSGGRIERVDLATGEVTVLYRECDGHELIGPNDLVFDETGGFWFTDHGRWRERDKTHGGLYYARPDGTEIREVVYPLDGPNGVGLSPTASVSARRRHSQDGCSHGTSPGRARWRRRRHPSATVASSCAGSRGCSTSTPSLSTATATWTSRRS
jgi:hypothetical protein